MSSTHTGTGTGTGMGEGFWNTKRTGELDAKLDPKLTAQRDAFGGGRRKLTYLEGHAAIAQLNRLFGYGGWSYSVDEMGVDEYTQGPQEQWYAGFWATVTLHVGGVSRQDVGCVEVQNTGKGGSVRDNVHNVDSRSTARKGAVTDALKRAARTFGQQLGNGLYDVDDDVYAWMTAHSLEAEEAEAPALASANGSAVSVQAPAGAPATPAARATARAVTEPVTPAQADPHATLRAQVVALLADDGPALALLMQQRKPLPPEQDAATLAKTRAWLMQRKEHARPAGLRLREAITRASSEEDVTRTLADARRAQEKKEITANDYQGLCRAGEARKTELSSPLLTGGPAATAS